MKTIPLSLRLLLRERRAGELYLLVFALVIAIGSLSSVGFLADRVKGALERESHQMLGADLLLTADRPWPDSLLKEIGDRRLQLARTTSFQSMITVGEGERARAQLADVKAVTAGYPLRGRLRIAPTLGSLDAETDRIPAPGEAWIDDRLAGILDLKPGDAVSLGKVQLRVGAILTIEPDRAINFFAIAPRLLINDADVASSGLIQTGSRVNWRLLVAGEIEAVADFKRSVEKLLVRGQRIEDVTNARPETRQAIERAQRFLGLAAMLSVVLAAVAVALAVRRYLQRHLDAFAVLRCLGATQAVLTRLALEQFLALAVVGSVIGITLGYAVHWAMVGLLTELVSIPSASLPAPTPRPALQGALAGLVLLMAFAVPPVLQLRKVPTLRVLRRELGAPELPVLGSALAGGAAVFGLLFWVAGDPKLGAVAGVSIAACLGVFAGLAWLSLKGLRRLATGWPADGAWAAWRAGALSLARRPAAASLQVLALSIGFLALLLLLVTRNELLDAWRKSTPADAPNRFVVNVQPEQVTPVSAQLKADGVAATLLPMVRGRLTQINGKAVGPTDFADERAQRLIDREFNLSWRDDLPEGNSIVAGRGFQPADIGQPVVTVEQGLADTLKLKVGDRLVFTIAGEDRAAEIVGLRKLNWDSMRVNFFVVFPTRVIEDAPASYITSFHLPAGRHDAANRLVQSFPNLTIVDISAIVRQLEKVIAQVSSVIEMISLFTLAAGGVVLYAALLAVVDERRKELAILRALGARKAQLARTLAVEFAVVGALAGLFAAAGAVVAGQAVARRAFEIETLPTWWLLPVAVGLGAVLAVLSGRFAISRLLGARPLDALREAE
jgi:putative ABC transport system permease protein